MRPLTRFLEELRQRGVFRAAALYAVVGLGVVEGADAILPRLGFQEEAVRAVVLVVLVGFPVTLVLSWLYDLVGSIQEADGADGTGAAAATPSRIPVLLGGALSGATVVAAVAIGWWTLGGDTGGTDASPGATRTPSVAVLPFADLSRGGDQQYFSDGIHEEIISRLSGISGLRVISRTSAMRFRETELGIPEIARRLGATAVLEGTVRHADDRVRITAQLIDSETDGHLWSESYDRDLEEIFAIQSDVATSIAGALEATLTPGERSRIRPPPAPDTEAYELYLLGRHHWHSFSGEGLRRALERFREAVDRDPAFAPAWVGIADVWILRGLGHGRGENRPAEAFVRAREALDRALNLDPDLPQALVSDGLIRSTYEYDWEGAERALLRAIELSPSNALAHTVYSMTLSTLGRDEEAIAHGLRARALDPLAPVVTEDLGWVLANAGRDDEALAQARRSLELDPEFRSARILVGRVHLRNGRYERALEAFSAATEISGGNPEGLAGMGYALARMGREDEARRILERLLDLREERYVSSREIAYLHLGLGAEDEALRWLSLAVEERAGWVVWVVRYPEWEPLAEDPRFRRIVSRMNLTPGASPPSSKSPP